MQRWKQSGFAPDPHVAYKWLRVTVNKQPAVANPSRVHPGPH